MLERWIGFGIDGVMITNECTDNHFLRWSWSD